MELSQFLQTLYTEGKVTVAGSIVQFEPDDLSRTETVLRRFYTEDLEEMPFTAPAFAPDAALWAAQFFYKAVQLTVLRDLDEAVVEEHLAPFEGQMSAETIYSADLVLRYLPALFGLAKGLSPRDVVVKKLKETALQWNFSSVGIGLDTEADLTHILGNASLKWAYIDRILRENDRERAKAPAVAELIAEALGAYPEMYERTIF